MDERLPEPWARPTTESNRVDSRRPRVLPYTAVAGATATATSRAARWRGRVTLGLLVVFVTIATVTVSLLE
jgi:hypothetical protein